jgi:proteasome lid subunit RPN8/RPN11
MKMTFAPGLLDQMRHQALAAFPNECCGLLVGRRGGFCVTRILSSPNVTAGDPAHDFEVDPGLRIRLERELRGGDDAIIGHYHSHPNGEAIPSGRDLAQAYEPELLWLIMAVTRDGVSEIAAYRLSSEGGGFEVIEFS